LTLRAKKKYFSQVLHSVKLNCGKVVNWVCNRDGLKTASETKKIALSVLKEWIIQLTVVAVVVHGKSIFKVYHSVVRMVEFVGLGYSIL
jgi:hypothetical protein